MAKMCARLFCPATAAIMRVRLFKCRGWLLQGIARRKSVVERKKSDKWACLPFFHEQGWPKKKKKCQEVYEIPMVCGFSFLSQTGCCFNDWILEHKRAVNLCVANFEIVKRKIVIIVVQVE
ncbi:hypothetical protein ISCGN_031133 [Ixodes scapularis]